jgi:hypothetical protein
MKKILKLTVTALLLLQADWYFADSMLQNNPSGNGGWRVYARARTWSPIHFGGQTMTDWNTATASKSSSWNGKTCAYQWAQNSLYSWSRNGYVLKNACGRGTALSDLGVDLASYKHVTDEEEDVILDRINMSTSGESRSGSDITITGLEGFMETHTSMKSFFSIKAWLPSSPADTTIDSSEVLYSGAIWLVDGEVVLEGNFVDDFTSLFDYSYNSTTEMGRIDFDGEDFTFAISLPTGTSINDIVVVSEDHVEYNTESSLRGIVGLTESQIANDQLMLKVFPNPSTDNVVIEYQCKENGTTRIKVYDEQGRFIDEVYQAYAVKNEKITVKNHKSLTGLPPGNYFIMIDNGESRHVTRLIKE